jgi:hypothetical protein
MDSRGTGIFPETLKSELHEVRSVIEAHSRQDSITGLADATACGINAVGATVRVTAQSGITNTYKIDRLD